VNVRNHPVTGDPILFAPERALRPRAFGGDDADRCPFCPGHESDTPATLVACGDPWCVRVFPNKYPPVAGAEVIVESPKHGVAFDEIDDAEEAVRIYVDRYRAHSDAAYVSLFKNEGDGSGQSIPHIHSQLVPLPFVPPRIAHETHAFASAADCPLCEVRGDVIRETSRFTWIAPHGSSMPYQQWIIPKRHLAEITALHDIELRELAALLQSASKAMRTLGDSYNWIFMNFPNAPAAHCYVELFPRVSKLGGFEFGSGAFVEIVDPALAAQRLKDALP
jgi:UDPglucose--hexose-1-phosphate uridylyltransferase